MSATPTSPSAVNWQGDLSTLTREQLSTRIESCATYAASRLRPHPGTKPDPVEAERALDLYAAARAALMDLL